MQIERNFSIPGARASYPFPDMEVGDSIFVEGQGSMGKANTAARIWGRKNDRKFSARAVDGGVRIWRVS